MDYMNINLGDLGGRVWFSVLVGGDFDWLGDGDGEEDPVWTCSFDDGVDGVVHGGDTEDGVLVLDQGKPDTSLCGPGFADPLIGAKLLKLGERGRGEIFN